MLEKEGYQEKPEKGPDENQYLFQAYFSTFHCYSETCRSPGKAVILVYVQVFCHHFGIADGSKKCVIHDPISYRIKRQVIVIKAKCSKVRMLCS